MQISRQSLLWTEISWSKHQLSQLQTYWSWPIKSKNSDCCWIFFSELGLVFFSIQIILVFCYLNGLLLWHNHSSAGFQIPINTFELSSTIAMSWIAFLCRAEAYFPNFSSLGLAALPCRITWKPSESYRQILDLWSGTLNFTFAEYIITTKIKKTRFYFFIMTLIRDNGRKLGNWIIIKPTMFKNLFWI